MFELFLLNIDFKNKLDNKNFELYNKYQDVSKKLLITLKNLVNDSKAIKENNFSKNILLSSIIGNLPLLYIVYGIKIDRNTEILFMDFIDTYKNCKNHSNNCISIYYIQATEYYINKQIYNIIIEQKSINYEDAINNLITRLNNLIEKFGYINNIYLSNLKWILQINKLKNKNYLYIFDIIFIELFNYFFLFFIFALFDIVLFNPVNLCLSLLFNLFLFD